MWFSENAASLQRRVASKRLRSPLPDAGSYWWRKRPPLRSYKDKLLSCVMFQRTSAVPYIIPVPTRINNSPRNTRRHVSCFLSNGCDRPPQAPAHRQQQKQKLNKRDINSVFTKTLGFQRYPIIGIRTMRRAHNKTTRIRAQ